MNASAHLQDLHRRRTAWVQMTRENGFERGIRNLLTELYPDEAHFIYELLQNAEDAGATSVSFELHADRLIVTHNGRAFNRKDVESITQIGESTKKDDINQIGKFGVGFKAVFAYTDSPQVISGDYAFEIQDLVCPVPIKDNEHNPRGTSFIFPFNHPQKVAHMETAEGLMGLTAEALLFLSAIQEITWHVAENDAYGRIERSGSSSGRIRIVRETSEKGEEITEWLRFQAPATDDGTLNLAIALRVGKRDTQKSAEEELEIAPTGKDQIIPVDGKLFIFFPADKETTKLRFHVHGPYASTVARDSIAHDRNENRDLIGRTADLLASALHSIRDMSLLDTAFLEVMPNDDDDLADFYDVLRERVVREMKGAPLVPTANGGYATSTGLYRGPKRIREVLSDADLSFLVGSAPDTPLAWAAGTLQNSLADRFLKSLGLKEWGLDQLGRAIFQFFHPQSYAGRRILGEQWLAGKSDEWMQRFYALLEGITSHYGLSTTSAIKGTYIVRLASGVHVSGAQAYFPVGGAQDVQDLPRVKAEILQGKSTRIGFARRCLEQLGVRTAGETEEIQAILDRYYSEKTPKEGLPGAGEHEKHITRFIAWWREMKRVDLFKNYSILRDGSGQSFRKPDHLYLDGPHKDTGLALIFSGANARRSPIWAGYQELDIPDFVEFCAAIGAMDGLPIRETGIQENPARAQLLRDYYRAGVRTSAYEIDRDCIIDNLSGLLARHEIGVSRLVWRTMCRAEKRNLTASYRPNASYALQTAPSHLVVILRDTEWIPDREGAFHKPADISRDQLPDGFPLDDGNGWLTAIEFGKVAAQRDSARAAATIWRDVAANTLQISRELVDELAALSSEDEAIVLEEIRKLKTRKLTQFPERESSNPERRRARIAETATDAPAQEYERRLRSVRISNREAKQEAREYLRELYTNDDDELVCQACKQEMPFKLSNGSYYFEAVEYLDLETEHRENHLALCPTCAARFRYALDTDAAELRESTEEVDDDEVSVRLAGEDWTIRFVASHLEDIRAVLEVSEAV